MRKYITLIILSVLIFQNNSFAQSFELGGFFGISGYRGDLQYNNVDQGSQHLAYGLVGRYNFDENLAVRAHYYTGNISGSDIGTRNANRNLHFQSEIKEYGAQAEYNFWTINEGFDSRFTAYGFAGLSVFQFRPEALLDNQWVDLQSLGTEGQYLPGSNLQPYNLTQIAIPFGIGAKFYAGELTTISFEAGLRKTFTDYLDDVSTNYPDLVQLNEVNPTAAAASMRANELIDVNRSLANASGTKRGSDNNDWFWFTGVTFTMKLVDPYR